MRWTFRSFVCPVFLQGLMLVVGGHAAEPPQAASGGREAGPAHIVVQGLNPRNQSSVGCVFGAGSVVYFNASIAGTNTLWRSDGTALGTVQTAASPAPSLCNGETYLVNGLLAYATNSGGAGTIWALQPTSLDPAGFLAPTTIRHLIRTTNSFYFDSPKGASNETMLLWKTNGATSEVLFDASTISARSSIEETLAVGNKLYFRVLDSDGFAFYLYVTDGTVPGTKLLKSSVGRGLAFLSEHQGKVFFRLDPTLVNPLELWTTDGTVAGTKLFQNTVQTDGVDMAYLNGVALFAAPVSDEDNQGTELWQSDGTPGGTTLLKDLRPSPFLHSSPHSFVVLNNKAYFWAYTANTVSGNPGLWTSDGTPEGTTLVKAFPVSATSATVVGNALYFVADDGVTGAEVWVSDGTPDGTIALGEHRPEGLPDDPAASSFASANGLVFYPFNDGLHGAELWKTNGTPEGTEMVEDINQAPVGDVLDSLAYAGTKLFFRGDDMVHGVELWSFDGKDAQLAKDIEPGAFTSRPTSPTVHNGKLFFVPGNGAELGALWVSDGTAKGTTQLLDPASASVFGFMNDAPTGRFFVATIYPDNVRQLYRSDGTPEGTIQLTSGAGLTIDAISLGVLPNGALLFADRTSPTRLWKSNGTPGGTVPIKDFGQQDYLFSQGAILQGQAYFLVLNPGVSPVYSLWKSDGTTGGTAKVFQWPANTSVNACRVAGTRLVMPVTNAQQQSSLWSSDGTAAHTASFMNLTEPVDFTYHALAVSGRVYFETNQIAHGLLASTDGTAQGTVFLTAPAFPDLTSGVDAGGRLLYASNSANSELWISDGTQAGTFRVQDIVPGSEPSSPQELTLAGPNVYFTARTAGGARPIWSVAIADLPLMAPVAALSPGVRLLLGGLGLLVGLQALRARTIARRLRDCRTQKNSLA